MERALPAAADGEKTVPWSFLPITGTVFWLLCFFAEKRVNRTECDPYKERSAEKWEQIKAELWHRDIYFRKKDALPY